MSDEVAKHFEQEAPKPEPSPSAGRSLTLAVTLHPSGELQFQWPQGATKIMVYGLLEMTRAQFDKMCLMAEAQQAHPSRGGINGLLKRMNGG